MKFKSTIQTTSTTTHDDENDHLNRSTTSSTTSTTTTTTTTTPNHNNKSHKRNNSFSKATSNASIATNTTNTSYSTAMSHESSWTSSSTPLKPSSSSSSSSSSSVQVAVRVRPSLPMENGTHKCITVHRHSNTSNNHNLPPNTSNMIEIGAGGSKIGGNSKKFYFDACFSTKAGQREVFGHSVQPLVNACLDGYNATVLAYGQTGSGKTHTILGPQESTFDPQQGSSTIISNDYDSSSTNSSTTTTSHSQAGIIPRALHDLFDKLESRKRQSLGDEYSGNSHQKNQSSNNNNDHDDDDHNLPYEYEVRVQFLELYGEEIHDLLSSSPSSNKLVIRDGVNHNHEPDVVGAIEIKVNNAADAMLCLTRGMLRRVTGATAMNAESSRSHAIMTVIVEQTTLMRSAAGGGGTTAGGTGGNNTNGGGDGGGGATPPTNSSQQDFESKRSKFHFVDLAGSERQKRSQAEGICLKEGIDINKGLLVLGNVISALGDPKKRGKSFVPYRDSKLTRLLKGSLGGNHKTLMIACVSPSSINMEESLNCLQYANQAKNIQNNAVINVDAGSKLVTELRGQVKALASELLNVQQKDSNGDKGRQFTNNMLRQMANGDDSTQMKFGSSNVNSSKSQPPSPEHQFSPSSSPNKTNNDMSTDLTPTNSNTKLTGREGRQLNAEKAFLDVSKAEISLLKQTIQALKSELASKEEELFAAKAEAEFYKMQLNSNDEGNNGAAVADGSAEKKEHDEKVTNESKEMFMNRVTEYEREIAKLKTELREVRAVTSTQLEVDDDNETLTTAASIMTEEHESPEKTNQIISPKRKKSEKKERLAVAALEKESKEEQQEIDRIAKKYIKLADNHIDEDDDDINTNQSMSDTEMDTEDMFQNRQAHLDAHMVELSKGITAKEELIDKLKLSQTKYEVGANVCSFID